MKIFLLVSLCCGASAFPYFLFATCPETTTLFFGNDKKIIDPPTAAVGGSASSSLVQQGSSSRFLADPFESPGLDDCDNELEEFDDSSESPQVPSMNLRSLNRPRIISIVGDGNCQFRAMSQIVYGNQAKMYTEIRALIAYHLEAPESQFLRPPLEVLRLTIPEGARNFILNEKKKRMLKRKREEQKRKKLKKRADSDDDQDGDDGGDEEITEGDLANYYGTDGNYGDDITLSIASNLFNIHFVVVNSNNYHGAWQPFYRTSIRQTRRSKKQPVLILEPSVVFDPTAHDYIWLSRFRSPETKVGFLLYSGNHYDVLSWNGRSLFSLQEGYEKLEKDGYHYYLKDQ